MVLSTFQFWKLFLTKIRTQFIFLLHLEYRLLLKYLFDEHIPFVEAGFEPKEEDSRSRYAIVPGRCLINAFAADLATD